MMTFRLTSVACFLFLLLSTSGVDGFFPMTPTFFQTCVFVDVFNCVGIPNGVYANCDTCSGFVTCTFGEDNTVDCPMGETYDVATGTCEIDGVCDTATLVPANPLPTTTPMETTTTPMVTTTPEEMPRVDSTTTAMVTTVAVTTKAPTVIVINGNGFVKTLTFKTGCVNSCQGQTSGYLPSCSSCSVVFICNNYYQKTGSCYGNAQWDDVLCKCVKWSSTCSSVVTRTQPQRHYYRSWWR